MKYGLKEITIDFGTFDYAATCIVGPWDGVEKYVRWALDDPSTEVGSISRGKFFYREGYSPIIWIPRKPKTPEDYGTLTHECMHLVRELMSWAGVVLSYETDETYCHAMGHAVRTVLKALKMNDVERLDELRGLSDGQFWFLASPYRRYSLGREAAYQFVLDCSDILEMEGVHHWSPIVNSHVAARKATLNPVDNKFWYSVNLRWMGAAYGLLILAMPGWEQSDGTKAEHDWFERNKKPIWLLSPTLLMPMEIAV